MILRATVGGDLHTPRTSAETSALIDRAFREQRTWMPGRGAGDSTDFFFDDGQDQRFPRSILLVRVNASTGLGFLAWWRNRPLAGEEHDIWVTDNVEPADEDPLVLAEAHGLASAGPAVVLPVEQLRAAVEEYCHTGTGGHAPRADRLGGTPSAAGRDGPGDRPWRRLD